MEKNKKNQETPLWVKVISELPPASQQVIGQIAASVVQNLAVLNIVTPLLVKAIYYEVLKPIEISDSTLDDMERIVKDADAFVDELVDDAKNGRI